MSLMSLTSYHGVNFSRKVNCLAVLSNDSTFCELKLATKLNYGMVLKTSALFSVIGLAH